MLGNPVSELIVLADLPAQTGIYGGRVSKHCFSASRLVGGFD